MQLTILCTAQDRSTLAETASVAVSRGWESAASHPSSSSSPLRSLTWRSPPACRQPRASTHGTRKHMPTLGGVRRDTHVQPCEPVHTISTDIDERWVPFDADFQVCWRDADVEHLRAHAGRGRDVHVHLFQILLPLVHSTPLVLERKPSIDRPLLGGHNRLHPGRRLRPHARRHRRCCARARPGTSTSTSTSTAGGVNTVRSTTPATVCRRTRSGSVCHRNCTARRRHGHVRARIEQYNINRYRITHLKRNQLRAFAACATSQRQSVPSEMTLVPRCLSHTGCVL